MRTKINSAHISSAWQRMNAEIITIERDEDGRITIDVRVPGTVNGQPLTLRWDENEDRAFRKMVIIPTGPSPLIAELEQGHPG